ncbi:MAG TPA: hypothetical protein VII48_07000 [Rhizomicrobium sp.]
MIALACLISFALGFGTMGLIIALRNFQIVTPIPEEEADPEAPEIERAGDAEFFGFKR